MKREFFGDSYDAVKRMWRDILYGWAPLYAEPRFIPEALRSEFTLLTRIPMLLCKPKAPFAILNDPDTGIRLPGAKNQSEGRSHISIATITKQLQSGAKCVITFDMSDYRNNFMKRDQQRRAKMDALSKLGFLSFYYVSHAPFLFALSAPQSLLKILTLLKNAGIPEKRLENIGGPLPINRIPPKRRSQ